MNKIEFIKNFVIHHIDERNPVSNKKEYYQSMWYQAKNVYDAIPEELSKDFEVESNKDELIEQLQDMIKTYQGTIITLNNRLNDCEAELRVYKGKEQLDALYPMKVGCK